MKKELLKNNIERARKLKVKKSDIHSLIEEQRNIEKDNFIKSLTFNDLIELYEGWHDEL